jgi:hydrogenase nickel incorporation protein HypB
MCTNCGCNITGEFAIHNQDLNPKPNHHHHTGHEDREHHHHSHDSLHHHDIIAHDHSHRQIEITQSILSKNDRLAERNRGFFWAKGLLVLNVLSSPGAGKTALIERMLMDLGATLPTAVIVGDLATDNDAQRLRRPGTEVVQITTGNACHLEAAMVSQAVQQLHLDGIQLLVIENVGNLVCPAAYDLGEDLRVVVFSVTEGEDKPLKYPTMFKIADVVIINKIDIAEVVGFDRETALRNIQQIAPQAQILEVSARTGQGMNTWYVLLQEKQKISGCVVNLNLLT